MVNTRYTILQFFRHSYLNEKSSALKCVLLWEWISWRSNQIDTKSDLYYDKAVERVLHYSYVKLEKDEDIQLDILRTLT